MQMHHPLEGTHWLRQTYYQHHLLIDGHWQASMKLSGWTGYHNADVQIGEEQYRFEKISQLKRDVAIYDDHGDEIGRIIQPKWYSSKLEIHYKERVYNIRSSHMPLTEYALCQGAVPLLRYGLKWEAMKLQCYRKAGPHEVPLLLEVALWYLFPAKTGYGAEWSTAFMAS